MKYLAFAQHDIFGLGGLVFTRAINDQFHDIIVQWSAQAWKNARADDLAFVRKQTEIAGEQIVSASPTSRRCMK